MGLESLHGLRKLIFGPRKIKEIKGLKNLAYLEELYLNENQIREIRGLKFLSRLETLWLNDNPLEGDERSFAQLWDGNAQELVRYCYEKPKTPKDDQKIK